MLIQFSFEVRWVALSCTGKLNTKIDHLFTLFTLLIKLRVSVRPSEACLNSVDFITQLTSPLSMFVHSAAVSHCHFPFRYAQVTEGF
jgi:hypothetical protein